LEYDSSLNLFALLSSSVQEKIDANDCSPLL